ncbi:hypothetical protein FQV39_25810 [Bosea sp. F3-2]|uniref:YciI family protein n=1 Tax=Bosea sp. F3-2 TaxID=2599640 RepID=UPI0011F02826|nr:hypothetical protein [Bosea sp. F3-2]QEL25634.1 hypothetical protein FQV39_25810 [Bosea sp. F3-2]
MFVVALRFSANKAQAPALVEAHNEWIRRGFEDGVFLMTGSLKPGLGGMVLAHGVTRIDLETRVNSDPFVAENVVSAEILEIAPGRADERLAFLLS